MEILALFIACALLSHFNHDRLMLVIYHWRFRDERLFSELYDSHTEKFFIDAILATANDDSLNKQNLLQIHNQRRDVSFAKFRKVLNDQILQLALLYGLFTLAAVALGAAAFIPMIALLLAAAHKVLFSLNAARHNRDREYYIILMATSVLID